MFCDCQESKICLPEEMSKDFLPDSEENPPIPASRPSPTPPDPEREAVQILVIGSKEGVTNIVQSLHSLRFAEVREWSPLITCSRSQ